MGRGRAKATNLAAKWRCDDDDAICSQATRGRVVVPRRAFAVRFPVEPCVLQGDAERLGESLESEVWGWLLSCGAPKEFLVSCRQTSSMRLSMMSMVMLLFG